jgi:hypothetical protein
MSHRSLTPISKAAKMLAEAKTLDEILHVENLAQRAKDFARAAGLGREAHQHAATVMLNARRKAGETLRLMRDRGDLDRGQGGDRKSRSQAATVKLEDLGLTKSQSSRYQLEASVPEDEYREWLAGFDETDQDITASGLRKLAKQRQSQTVRSRSEPIEGVCDSLEQLIDAGKTFACIYADPPWAYGNQGTRAATNNHYPTLTVAEICAEPVVRLAAENAHLHLWTTNGFHREAFDVLDAWGFTYKSCLI